MNKSLILLSMLLIGCKMPKAELSDVYIPSFSEKGNPFTDINPDLNICLKKEYMECLIPFAAIYGHDEYIDKYVVFGAVVVATTEHNIAYATHKSEEVKKIYLFQSHDAAIRCNVLEAIEVRSDDFDNMYKLYRKYTGTYINFGGYLRDRNTRAWRILDISKLPNRPNFIPEENTLLSNSNKNEKDFCITPYSQATL